VKEHNDEVLMNHDAAKCNNDCSLEYLNSLSSKNLQGKYMSYRNIYILLVFADALS